MELSFSSRLRPPLFFHPTLPSSNSNLQLPMKDLTPFQLSRPRFASHVAMARRKTALEGVSDELNRIAAADLDHAPARRQVRSAFMEFQQQLDHWLFKPTAVGIRTEEWYEINTKGLEIFCKSWLPEAGPVKGVVCFCHGYGDTCTFFFDGIARKIAQAGYAIFAVDHPGFGLSDGLHGYISSFDDIVDNAIEQYTKIKERPQLRELPSFIFGQSMGGAIALKVHLKEPHAWDGVLLVAPMCKWSLTSNLAGKISAEVMPPEALLKVANVLSNVAPKCKFFAQQDLAELAFRDPRKRQMASYNVICYNQKVRLKTAMELLKATTEIEARLDKVCSPLLVLHGAADRVTDPNVSRYLYEKASSKDKMLKLYEGGFHSILEGEPDELITEVFADIIGWLDSRCPSS